MLECNTETDTRHVFGIYQCGLSLLFLSLIPGISISLVGKTIHCLQTVFDSVDLYIKKCVFCPLIQPSILCIEKCFGEISPPRQYTIFVSPSKDNTCVLSQESEIKQGLVFWGVQILRQHK
jgi:hypothetical protein